MNRAVWDVRGQNGLTMPPGHYQARLTLDGAEQTEPFNVLIDPRIAAEGVMPADLVEQYDHNVRMRALQADVQQTLARVNAAKGSVQNDAAKAAALEAIRLKIVATPEGVRYNKPGLQEHVNYLAGMTSNVDQKIGRDAIERYNTLRKELDDIRAQLDKLLGAGVVQ